MKIEKIRFKNIHSLKGSHEIDFTIPPLCNSGLFAITGPTGAGKSTILDVITLALFNEIPRFNKKISIGEITKVGSVVTHFADIAQAEIEYQSNGIRYRSTWEVKKNRNGNWNDYDMELATLPDGNIIDGKKSDIPKRNEQIIGLNYEQFIRSILLSQGEFAKFLKSSEKERAELLENITGTEIYREIGKAAFLKAKLHKEEIEQKKLAIASISIWSETELAEKNQLNIYQMREIDILRGKIEDNNKKINTINQYLAVQKKWIETNELYRKWQTRKENFDTNENIKITKHEELDQFKIPIHQVQTLKNNISELEQRNIKLKQQSTELEVALNQAVAEATQLVNRQLDTTNYINILRQFEQEINQFDNDLKVLKDNGLEQNKLLNSQFEQNSSEFDQEIKALGKDTDAQLNYINEKLFLIEQTIDFQKSDVEIQHIIDKQSIEIERINKNYIAIQTKNEIVFEIENQKKQIENVSAENKITQQNLYAIQLKKNELSNSIVSLKKEIDDQVLIKSLDDHRRDLLVGERCPLCGSQDHPYLEHHELIEFGKNALDLKLKENELKAVEDEFITNINIKSKNEGLLENLQLSIINLQNKYNNVIKSIDDDFQQVEYEIIGKMLNQTKQHYQLNLNQLQSRSLAKHLKNVKSIIEKIKQYRFEYIAVNNKRKLLYNGENIAKDVEALLSKINNKVVDLQSNQIKLKELQYSIEGSKVELENLSKSLEINLLNFGYTTVDDANRNILSNEEYSKLKTEKTAILGDEIKIGTTLKELNQNLKELQLIENEKDNLGKLIEETENFNKSREATLLQNGSLKLEIAQNNEKILLYEKEKKNLEILQKNAHKWLLLDGYIGDATGTKYAKFAQNLNLSYLISFANHRLKSLTDRYLLAREDMMEEFKIIDLYQGGSIRSVKTLSGGESFLVSLALALSLSDIASKNVKLESLFIDEGFGTLDAETLEISIATLEKLQAESNRTIGIISHIDSLKDRIHTKIQLEKNNLGFSKINIVG